MDEIFASLTKASEENGHFKVYNQKNMPERWHVNNQVRFGPIVAVADIGYGFQDLMNWAIDYKERFNIPSEFQIPIEFFAVDTDMFIHIV